VLIPNKPQPFLGVVTDPLEPALSAQLGLTNGLGLIVNHVLPDSPAPRPVCRSTTFSNRSTTR
jgi:S1-C subfamily serine protease